MRGDDVVDRIMTLADAETACEPDLPAEIGGRRILRRIGGGGMGAVYLGEQDHPRREIAIKLLHPGAAGLARHEIEAVGRLRHPHIAIVHDASLAEPPQRSWIVMEFIPGAQPITRYATSHDLPRATRLGLFRDAALAIAHAHENGVLHCDIKPQNVLVDEDGVVKVIDFGLARRLHESHTDHPTRAGTFGAMSPEQLAGARDLTTRSDVFSLSALLYELLTDERPFGLSPDRDGGWERGDVRPMRTTGARVDATLEAIVAKGLADNPADRYADVNALLADLDRWSGHRPVEARTPSARYELACCLRRHRRAFAVIGLVATALVAGGFGVWRERQAAVAARDDAIGRFRDARDLAYGLTNFAHDLRNTLGTADMRSQMLHESLERLVALLDNHEREPESDAALVHTLSLCAAMDIECGRTDVARARLERAAAIYDAIDAPSIDLQCEYSDILARRGDIERHEGSPDAALAWYERALAVDEGSHEARPDHRRAKDNLVWDYGRLGMWRMQRKEYDAARGWLERQHEIAVSLVETHPEFTSSRHAHFISHWNLARLDEREGDAAGAAEHDEEARVILDAMLDAEPGSPQFRAYRISDLRRRGVAAEAAGDLDTAQRWFEAAFEEARLLYTFDSAVMLHTKVYLASAGRLARFWAQQGNHERAVVYADLRVDVARAFAAKFPDRPDSQRNLERALRDQVRITRASLRDPR